MTTLREAATQALEALEGGADSWQLVGPAIDALKAALVEDAMQKFTDVNQELEAALAEPDWQDLYLKEKKRADMWRDKYESVAGAEQRIHPLAEPVQEPVCAHGVGKTKCGFCSVENKQPVQEPVAGRAFLERILAAMEGVIDVADRKTDEFDALRSCVIDLTLMLHTSPPQRPAKPVQDPVAWSYELATTMLEHGYDGWEHLITRYKPNVPEGSIRNLTPLYTSPPQRKPPIADEALWEMWVDSPSDVLAFARRIEMWHGIT